MYVRVYSPDGEPFEVTRERADRLILQEGWTQTAPEPVEPEPVDEYEPEVEEEPTRPARGRKSTRKKTSEA